MIEGSREAEKELTTKVPGHGENTGTIWVLIPAHNEAGRIGLIVRGAKHFAGRVLVVADGCSDGTGEEARAAGAEVLELEVKRGKGAALRAGWFWLADLTDWQAVILMDGDGQHDPVEIPDFLEAWDGEDMVLGTRCLAAPRMPWLRRMTNRFMTASLRGLAGCPVRDSQCGFRLLSRGFALGESWSSEHFEIESEMIWRAARRGWKVKQVSVSVRYDGERSKIRPWLDTWRWVRNCLTLRAQRAQRSLREVEGV